MFFLLLLLVTFLLPAVFLRYYCCCRAVAVAVAITQSSSSICRAFRIVGRIFTDHFSNFIIIPSSCKWKKCHRFVLYIPESNRMFILYRMCVWFSLKWLLWWWLLRWWSLWWWSSTTNKRESCCEFVAVSPLRLPTFFF